MELFSLNTSGIKAFVQNKLTDWLISNRTQRYNGWSSLTLGCHRYLDHLQINDDINLYRWKGDKMEVRFLVGIVVAWQSFKQGCWVIPLGWYPVTTTPNLSSRFVKLTKLGQFLCLLKLTNMAAMLIHADL